MNLDGAENAKAEVFLKAFRYREIPMATAEIGGPIFAPAPGSAAHADIREARRLRTVDAKEKIAVGLVRSRRNAGRSDGVKLGLFIQHDRYRHHPVVEAALKIAPKEAEIIVTGRVRRQAGPKVRPCRPLRMGESIGHYRITAGTIGCFGVDRSGAIGLVSNNHVLARNNDALAGDLILQPGRADGGSHRQKDHVVAKLQTYIPIDFDPTSFNFVDCAFARLAEGQKADGLIVGDEDIGADRWTIGEIEDLLIDGAPVKKVGRTTRFTEGTVEAISVDNVQVQMMSGARPRYAMFNRQVVISGTTRTFSKGGDSGSLICTTEGRPVALLFAGTDTGGRNGRGITYANPIRPVLDALDIELYYPSAGA